MSAIGCVVCGQYLMTRSEPLTALPVALAWIEERFILRLANLTNTAFAVILLVAGILAAAHYGPRLPMRAARWDFPHPLGIAWSPLWLPLGFIAGLFAWMLMHLRSGGYAPEVPLVYLGIVALSVAIAWERDRTTGVRLRLPIDRHDWLALVLLLIAGLAVGSYRLDVVPSSMIGDEGAFWDLARAIAQGRQEPVPFDLGVYSYPVLSSIYQATVMHFVGVSLWGWRFSSVFAAALALVPSYLLARQLFGRRVALATGVLMLSMPYYLAFARLGYNNAHSLLPMSLTLWFLVLGLQRGSISYTLLAGIAAGAGFYTYTAARLAAVVACLLLLLLLIQALGAAWRGRKHAGSADQPALWRRRMLAGIVFGLGMALVTLPHLAYAGHTNPQGLSHKLLESIFFNSFYGTDLYGEAALYRDYPPLEMNGQQLFFRPDLYAEMIVRGAVRTALVFHRDDLVTEHFIASPLPGSLVVVFYTIGLGLLLGRLRSGPGALLAVWLGSGVLLLSILNTFPPRHQHMVPLIPAIALVSALGLVALAELVGRLWQGQRGVRFALAIGLLAGCSSGLHTYFVTVPDTYPPNLEQAIGFTALALDTPTRLIYVTAEPAEMPWIIRSMKTPARYQTLTPEAFAQDAALDPAYPAIIFFQEADLATVAAALAPWQDSATLPELFLDRGGATLGMAWTLGDVAIPPYLGEGHAGGLVPEVLAGAVLLALIGAGWGGGSAFLKGRLPGRRARSVTLRVRLDGNESNAAEAVRVPAHARVLVHVEPDSAAPTKSLRGG